jgi:hypothetical protein
MRDHGMSRGEYPCPEEPAMSTEPDDVSQLRTELASLRQQLASEKQARSARTRNIVSWILVVLAVLATILALLSVWVFRTMNNTDLFVERVGSIIQQPEVSQAIGERAACRTGSPACCPGRPPWWPHRSPQPPRTTWPTPPRR